jgi:hypothetical protein
MQESEIVSLLKRLKSQNLVPLILGVARTALLLTPSLTLDGWKN